MEESVVLTATLRDELSAPLEGVNKEITGSAKAVEKANKDQASSTKEAAGIMTTALDKASGASSDMGKAMEQASGTGKSAWGKLRTEVTQASNDAITQARKQATELSTSVKVQESALTHLEGAHRDAQHAQEQAASGATAAQQRLDEMRATATTKASALTKAEATLQDAQFKADRSSEAAEQAARDLTIGRDDLAAATKRLGEVQDVAGQKLTGFASLTEGVTQKQRDAISTLAPAVAVAGGAMSAGFGVMLKTYADFDKAMSGVQAATHETTQNMRLLREEAIRVGADTAFSAGEAAQGIEELAKAGVSTEAILNGGLAGALDLAAAGELAVGEAAEIAATAMTQFKLKGKDIPHIADLLAAGAGKAQGSVKDLGEALNQAGLVSASTGLTIEETAGTLASFAEAGLTGSDAGTSLKSMLQRLQAPSNKASKEMEALGINMYDANGAFAGMQSLAGQLANGELAELTQAERDASMAIIFGADAVRAANVLYTNGAEGIQKWTEAVDDAGYAALTASTMQNNLAGDLEKLGGAFDTVFLKSGSGANDVLRELVQYLEGVVDQVGQIPGPVLSVIGILTGLTGGTLLLVGTLGVLAPKIKDGVGALRDLGLHGGKATTTMGKLGRAAGLAGAAIAAAQLSGQLVSSNDVTTSEEYAQAIFNVAKAGDKAASSDLDSIFKKWNLTKGAEKDAESVNSLSKAVGTLTDPGTGAKIKNFFNPLTSFLGATPDEVTQVEGKFVDLGNAIGTMVTNGRLDEARATFATVTKEFEANGQGAQEAMNAMPGYSDALRAVATEAGVAVTEQDLLNWAISGVEPAAVTAARGAETLDTALEEVGVTTEGLVEDMEKFLELLFATGLATMSARDASAAFHEATRGTSDAIKSAKDALQAELETKGHSAEAAKVLAEQQYNLGAALNKSKTDFDITTAAGAALNSGFQEIARAGMADIEAASKAGMGQDELQVKLRTTYDALIKDANAKGIAGEAADALARDVMGIPDKANIDTWMDDRAKSMAEETKTAVDAVTGEVKVGSSMDDNALTMAQRTSAALNGIPSVKNVRVVTNHVELPAKQSMGETIANSWKPPGASGGAVFMAAGGAVLPGYAPGVDDIRVMASRGESILVPELTRAIGPANIMALNHEYSGGRPAGAGPGRSALSQVLGLATNQTMTTNHVTSTLTSYTPAAGGAVLSDFAPSAGQPTQSAPSVAVGQPGTSGRQITVQAGAVVIQLTVGNNADAQDIAETVKAAVTEAIEELENDHERTYA